MHSYTCIHAGPPNIHKGRQCRTLFQDLVICGIGSNYCISDPVHVNDLPLVREIFLNCVHDSTIPTPYPLRVMWFLNGEPIDNIRERSRYRFISIPIGQALILINIAVNDVRGNYTCQLNNTAGSDVATTIISTCSSK